MGLPESRGCLIDLWYGVGLSGLGASGDGHKENGLCIA
jgi:hypothetical protein